MNLRRNWLPVAAVGVYAAAAGLVQHLVGAAMPPLCLFRLTTGIPCPGCGTTRAGLALLTGHFAEALRHNPLAACLLVLAALGAATWLLARAIGREWRPSLRGRARALGLIALAVAIGLNWAYLITLSPSRIGTRLPVWAHRHRTH